jgi:hypothetical protein
MVSYGDHSSQSIQNFSLISAIQKLLNLLRRQRTSWSSRPDIFGCFEGEVACCRVSAVVLLEDSRIQYTCF